MLIIKKPEINASDTIRKYRKEYPGQAFFDFIIMHNEFERIITTFIYNTVLTKQTSLVYYKSILFGYPVVITIY